MYKYIQTDRDNQVVWGETSDCGEKPKSHIMAFKTLCVLTLLPNVLENFKP